MNKAARNGVVDEEGHQKQRSQLTRTQVCPGQAAPPFTPRIHLIRVSEPSIDLLCGSRPHKLPGCRWPGTRWPVRFGVFHPQGHRLGAARPRTD
jgi:hypothetical protein